MVVSKHPYQYRIPDLLRLVTSSYPGPHPRAAQATEESIAWICSYEPFGPPGETSRFFDKSGAGGLGGYTFPYASYKCMRACIDFINVIITLDEISDLQGGDDARAMMEKHLRILFSGECDGSPVSRITVDLRNRMYDTFNAATVESAFKYHKDTIMLMVEEAENRERKKILSVDAYTEFRIKQGALPSVFYLIEGSFGFVLPKEVHEDPVFQLLQREAIILVLWTNDICSYNNEQSREGHAFCNFVTALKNEENLDVQQAMDRMDEIMQGHFKQFNECKARLRSFGEKVDTNIRDYIYGLESWISGQIVFCFDIPKYFQVGPDHLDEVKKTRIVTLLTETETDMCFVR